MDTCSLIWKKNECFPPIFEYSRQATCWKSDEFRYILQPVSCSHPIFQIEKHICTFYIDIHSLKYFQSIYRSCCKVRTQFVTCKLGDCRVWTLTNPINSKPTHNSGGGVGIRTDSYRPFRNSGDGQRHMCLWTRDVTHVTGFAQKADPHQNSCVTLPLLLQIGWFF